jgi:hypothetical protein
MIIKIGCDVSFASKSALNYHLNSQHLKIRTGKFVKSKFCANVAVEISSGERLRM